ncbi:hypothetical protein EDD17DRAFT_1574516 [Pisolithus thermaeus]|nr:hypothetical protein EDD17DRAFT_1574516 [Pisolithus thermaeus]
MIYCRILGYLFHHFPALNIMPFVREIVTINGQRQDLLRLGECYYNFFVRLFKANEGSTPVTSSYPSRRSFDRLADMIENMLQEAPQSPQTAKKRALVRDGFQCAVTKIYDWKSILNNKELEMKVMSEAGRTGSTHCTHIFPESTDANITAGSDEARYATSLWAILDRFGYSALREEFNGSNINRLENVVTLEPSLHSFFDSLQVWFTETEEPNRYKLEATHDIFLVQRPKYATFSTPNPQRLPLPSPTYLAIHAACAKVAHFSGAGEYIRKILRRMEDTRVLAEDGGSAELLHMAMLS